MRVGAKCASLLDTEVPVQIQLKLRLPVQAIPEHRCTGLFRQIEWDESTDGRLPSTGEEMQVADDQSPHAFLVVVAVRHYRWPNRTKVLIFRLASSSQVWYYLDRAEKEGWTLIKQEK